MWDSLEHNPFGRIASDAMRSAFNADPPPFMSVPFGYAAIDPIKASLLANGFHDLRIDLVRRQGAIADIDRFADGLVHGSPLADQIRSRGADPRNCSARWRNRCATNSARPRARRFSSFCSTRGVREGLV